MKLLALWLPSSPLHACAVCFGKSDQPGLIQGLTWGLILLLAFTFLAVSGIALVALRIEKHRPALGKDSSSSTW